MGRKFKGDGYLYSVTYITRRGDSEVIDIKPGEGGRVGVRGGLREKARGRGKGAREEGKSIDPRGRFLRIQGNRFRDRKGAALIALPARSCGLGTILFHPLLSPFHPLARTLAPLFCSYPRPPFLTKLDISTVTVTCPKESPVST